MSEADQPPNSTQLDRTQHPRPTVTMALIAHDKQKPAIVEFVRRHLEFFRQVRTVATGQTGTLLSQELGLDVERAPHGPAGGDLVIGGKVATGAVEAVIFFRDPLTAQAHEPDVSALMRVCDVHQIPLATNPRTAEAIIDWLSQRYRHQHELPGRRDFEPKN